MVEHRPLSDFIAYAILTLGIFIVAFPVYLALVASTHDAATVVGGHMPATPGSQTLENYYRAVFVGGSRTSREPVANMLINSFVSAIGIAVGKIFISILSGKLPKADQARARRLGLGGAFVTRILLLLSIAWIVRLTTPLFTLAGIDFTGRNLILLFGGLFLIGKATFEIHGKLEGSDEVVVHLV